MPDEACSAADNAKVLSVVTLGFRRQDFCQTNTVSSTQVYLITGFNVVFVVGAGVK